MDYQKHYKALCEKAQARELVKGHRHHIVPKCLNGSNAKSNLVMLTESEHFIAHLLLAKIHPDKRGLVIAARLMGGLYKNKSGNPHINNKVFAVLRKQAAEVQKGQPSANKGKPMSAERKAQHSKTMTGRPSPNKGKSLTVEQKAHLSLINTGKKQSEETKAKRSAAMKGYKFPDRGPSTEKQLAALVLGRGPRSEETKARISAKAKGRKAGPPSAEARMNLSISMKKSLARKRERRELTSMWFPI